MSRAVPVIFRKQYDGAGSRFRSDDALWDLREKLRVVPAAKMAAQRQELDERLRDLEQFATSLKRAVAALRPMAESGCPMIK
ncbi:hypothetical protein [Tardiphaga sp. 813_E8_N1_3]|uniref:hypothetical protein n=1 Tax=Tardiphaga sp. 813_E8_N1_3 TaxID=3240760 RepID=UPI003F25374C